MSQVTCPQELTAITNYRRADHDHFGFRHNIAGFHIYFDPQTGPDCGFQDASVPSGENCLSRMMDCRKPSAAFSNKVPLDKMCPGMKLIPSCTRDGYTRLQNDCGGNNCYS